MKLLTYVLFAVCATLIGFCPKGNAFDGDRVGLYSVYELTFSTSATSKNPFDSYLLKLEVTDPDGKVRTVDGFFDGNGAGGQDGNIWKARICPYKTGIWRWRTVPGDTGENSFGHQKGEFVCYDNGAKGGLSAQGKYFKYQNGPFVYLQGNFLDFSHGLESTHVYMGEGITDDKRKAILKRQLEFHKANKVNLYLANKGDYKRKKVTPWMKDDSDTGLTRMDLGRWRRFEGWIAEFGEKGLFAEIWFFADDSGFGSLSKKEKEILFRYGMARLSSLSNTFFIICLEWDEEWSKAQINAAGEYIQTKNPWNRPLSVHGLSVVDDSNKMTLKRLFNFFKKRKYWEFSDEKWPAFIATQVGNGSTAQEVNQLAIKVNKEQPIPHLSEEFGILKDDSDINLREKMWANFCGGAAGGGTGSDIASFINFIERTDIPFEKMKPSNTLLMSGGKNSFCLSEAGKNYVVYSKNGKVNIRIEGSNMTAYWYNVRERDPPFIAATAVEKDGRIEFEPPDMNKDWVLWIRNK